MAGAIRAVRLAELLAALSLVTDLGHGQPTETAIRACLLATKLAQEMRLSSQEVADVFYTALLRHIGCTAYAHEEAAIFGGDEIEARGALATVDLGSPREMLAFGLFSAGRTLPPVRRAGVMLTALPRSVRALTELATSVCEVGAGVARRLGLSEAVQESLNQVYERWDGKGTPRKLAGEQLALPVRFAQVATQAIALADQVGIETAAELVRRRSGGALDPTVAEVFLRCHSRLLPEIASIDVWATVVETEPEPQRRVVDAGIDEIARTFGDLIDLKIPFTRGHSAGVAELAERAAGLLRLGAEDAVTVRRAALFHDLGRAAVPNGIWEKPGKLTASDWERVRLHPYHTERILAASPALAELARTAGAHHERMDGSGYYRQARAAELSMPARLLAAADAYQAMTQERPYRPPLTRPAVEGELRRAATEGKLDPEAVAAVVAAADQTKRPLRRSWPGGLTEREIEVLRLIAEGSSYKDVAARLIISPRTAAHHVQHIYNKIGVSTRAGAAMFAMEHDLLTR